MIPERAVIVLKQMIQETRKGVVRREAKYGVDGNFVKPIREQLEALKLAITALERSRENDSTRDA